jgi:hypothetical protein
MQHKSFENNREFFQTIYSRKGCFEEAVLKSFFHTKGGYAPKVGKSHCVKLAVFEALKVTDYDVGEYVGRGK